MNAIRPSDEPRSFSPPEKDAVHVWTAWLGDGAAYIETLEPILSGDEAQKAGRFLRSEDRTRYIVAHGFLRKLLARYTATKPTVLRFTTNEFGKPALVQSTAEQALCFNLSHSRDLILCAVTASRRVGADVEAIKSDLDVMELARNQFADEEIEALAALPANERQNAFFRLWTCKEAYVKARGEGLSCALDKFTVSIGCAERPFLRPPEDDPSATTNWSIFSFDPHPGYAAAVVVEGCLMKPVSYRWDDSLW